MSVGVLVVAHNHIGDALLEAVSGIMGTSPMPVASLAVTSPPDLGELVQQGHEHIQSLDRGHGVLILTDAFGSTPSNLAVRLGAYTGTAVVSGFNLPMLLRVMNYPDSPLEVLQERAYTGGRDGVIRVDTSDRQQTDAASRR